MQVDLYNGHKTIVCVLYVYYMFICVCSESTSFNVNAHDSSLDLTVSSDATEDCSFHIRLIGVSFLPMSLQGLHASTDHLLQLRLGLKEVVGEDFSEKCLSATNSEASVETLQSAPFYYHCRKCSSIVLDHRL